MQSKFSFTVTRLNELQPKSKRYYVYDKNQPGLRLYITEKGVKTFQFQARSRKLGKTVSRTLGKYPALTIPEARQESVILLSEINSGIDIEQVRRDQKQQRILDPTVKVFANIFMDQYVQANNRRTWKETSRILNKDIIPVIGNIRMRDVKKQDIRRVLKKLENRNAYVARNRTLSVLSKMFNFALDEDVIEFPPTFGIKKMEVERKRNRVLSDNEIKLLWEALEKHDTAISSLTMFLLISGQRTGETRQMLFSEIDDNGIWTIPENKTKNNEIHIVPLSSKAMDIVQKMKNIRKNDYVFPGHITGKCLSVNAVSNFFSKTIKDFNWERTTPHDLRRTVRTRLAMLKVRKIIAECVLNHKQQGVAGIYDRYDYFDEKKEALQKWSDRLQEIVTNKDEKSN